MGKYMYQIRNAFSELEHSLISERTKAGMAAAKKCGAILGRPKKLTDEQVIWVKNQLSRNSNLTLSSLAKSLDLFAPSAEL